MEKQRRKRRSRIITYVTIEEIKKAIEEQWGTDDPIGNKHCLRCVSSNDCWSCDLCSVSCMIPFDYCHDEWEDDEHIYERKIDETGWEKVYKEIEDKANDKNRS